MRVENPPITIAIYDTEQYIGLLESEPWSKVDTVARTSSYMELSLNLIEKIIGAFSRTRRMLGVGSV